MMRKRFLQLLRGCVLIGTCFSLLLVGACAKKQSEEEPSPGVAKQNDPAIMEREVSVLLRHIDGKTVQFSEYRGRIVLVNFFASWQRKDFAELVPIMAELQRKTQKRVDVIYVAIDEASEVTVRRFIEEHNVTYDVFVNGKEVAGAFGGVGKLPATFIVYDDGKLIDRIEGLRSRRYYWGRLFRTLKRRS
ncbi:MAG: TlpA family protein disulfide reductase [bacterium]|nr:MAG: TlpA family protein disulfide reductase [bacterium]